MKKIILFIFLILTLFLLVSCSSEEDTAVVTPSFDSEEMKQPEALLEEDFKSLTNDNDFILAQNETINYLNAERFSDEMPRFETLDFLFAEKNNE